MKKIVLISCCKSKLQRRARARDLYVSPLFRLSLRYAESLTPDNILILSAKYHLLDLNKVIEPYELTINSFTAEKRRGWGIKITEQLSDIANLNRDLFIILAGKAYIKPLRALINHSEEPLHGLRYGERLKFLKEILESN